MRMIKINSFYSGVQVERLKELSDSTGITVSEHLRRAVDLYLKEKPCKTLQEKSLGD
jgi:hypothetical protein